MARGRGGIGKDVAFAEGAAGQPKNGARSEKPEVKALLKAANSASARLATLHVAFMATCAYVLVIAFGTTHLNLLLGEVIKLPVVNVELPIVPFYALAPFIVVLAHFNLLLQLQLLSRKLFAFAAAAPPEEGPGGWRDRLHIFPFTYYLVDRPSPLLRPLLGLMVSITVVLLPFLTLLALQHQFLAYQGEVVTWCQRAAIWLDIAVLAILWPIILQFNDDWRGYWGELLAAQVPRRRVWLAFALLFAGLVLVLFGVLDKYVLIGIELLLFSALSLIPLRGWQATSRTFKFYLACLVAVATLSVAVGLCAEIWESRHFFLLGPLLLLPFAVLWQPQAPRGSLTLLLTLLIGPLVPMALLVDGKGLEGLVLRFQPRSPLRPSYTLFSEDFLGGKRQLNLNEQVLLAKAPRAETLALIHSGDWREGLKQVAPLNLQSRNFRHAQMKKVILMGANLREAQLQGADLEYAQLQRTDLMKSQLQGAKFEIALLQGANSREAQLQGSNLREAQLQGADLRGAYLYAAEGIHSKTELIDAREVVWAPLKGDKLKALSKL